MPNTDKHIILEASQLSIGYQNKKVTNQIANDINFSLTKGELIGLVGANGIGKSTLLKTLTKDLKSLAGTISLSNIDLNKIDAQQLAQQLSVVLTENVSQTNLTVQELVALGRQPYTNWIGQLTPLDKEKTQQAIDWVQINDIKHKKCFELSDGQLQKVMLARALAQDTPLIILDEPTTHLDLYHKVYILKLLQKLAKETQKTILFSTHEINVALSLCDKMLVMTSNETYFGTPSELINQKAFHQLFPNELIAFNDATNSFIIK